MYQKRIKKLKKIMIKNNWDCILITKNTDLYYFSGFYTNDKIAYLIITRNKNYFITDPRFYNQFKKEVTNFELIKLKNHFTVFDIIKKLLNLNNINKLAFSFDDISYKLYWTLELHKYKNFNCRESIDIIRSIKDNQEIQYIKQAIDISIKSFNDLLDYLKPGKTELEIKNYLEYCLYKYNSSGLAFPTIVASGKTNGALPHSIPTERTIKYGDLITIDFGAKYNNYCSDITRTIAVGDINENLKTKYYEILNTKIICAKLLKPKIESNSINHKFIEEIKKINFYPMHSIGHSFGLDIHEKPSLSSKSNTILKKGNVVTIEPGIYKLKFGGIRIEDDYLITEDSYECLSGNLTCDLITIK